MEIFVILLADLILAPLIGIGMFVAEIVMTLLAFVIDIVIKLTGKEENRTRRTREEKASNETVTIEEESETLTNKRISSRTLNVIKKILLAGLVIFIAVFMAINFVFFEQTLNFITKRITQKTGINIDFSSAKGNIFTGNIQFSDLKVKRLQADKDKFDFVVGKAQVDIDMLSLILGNKKFEHILVSDVKGKITQKTKTEQADRKATNKRKYKPKSSFVINDLKFSNIDLSIAKEGKEPVNVVLEKVESSPFRSHYAVFDIFFRSNVNAKIDGHVVNITTSGTDIGRKTRWNIDNLPVQTVSRYIDKAPLNWFTEGTVSIDMVDTWQKTAKLPDIYMDWDFKMHDIRMEAPEGGGLANKIIGAPMAKYVNSKDGDVDLNFSFVMNEGQFGGVYSLDASGIWNSLVGSLTKTTLAKSVSKDAPEIKNTIKEKYKGLKGFFKKKKIDEEQNENPN